jgi:uncharacterized membrane protein (UPF0127 family)
MDDSTARRLRRLTTVRALGLEVPVASDFRSRLLGLSFLDREAAGGGLLIPRCAGVHTFGMRFPLDLLFLDPGNGVVALHLDVPRRRFVFHRDAAAVLELPARTDRTVHRFRRMSGGEMPSPAT